MLNGLQVAVRRGRVTAAYRDASLADLRALAIAIDPETEPPSLGGDVTSVRALRPDRWELMRAAQAENVPLVGTA